MNSLILTSDNLEITNSKVLDHVHTTLKLKVNDTIKVTKLNKGLGEARVKSITPHSLSLEMIKEFPATKSWFNLIVGASRPPTMKKILEHGTTFGASAFHFYKAELSEKSYLDSTLYKQKEFEDYLLLGLSQSATYSQLPAVELYSFNPALKFKDQNQNFILDINGKETFLDQKIDFNAPINLSIGPERGFTLNDIDHFTKSGFKSIKISKSILRVEHAIYSSLGQLEMMKRDFL